MLRLCAILAVFGAALGSATVANAATVRVSPDGRTLIYEAAPGESNHVAIADEGPSWTVTETGASLSVDDPRCGLTGAQTASCPTLSAAGEEASHNINVSLGDGDDWASVANGCSLSFVDLFICSMLIDGEEGNDTLVGPYRSLGDGAEARLRGGGGEDMLLGGGENDVFAEGGDGDDLLVGDSVDGGPGADTLIGDDEEFSVPEVVYSDRVNPVFVSLNGRRDDGERGENDLVVDVLGIVGGSGADVIVGDSRGNWFSPGSGNDIVYGGEGSDRVFGCSDPEAGADRLFGQAGNDFLSGCGGNDVIYGGLGRDSLAGEEGSDRLFGIDQADTIQGGLGNDTIGGGLGEDDLRGQEGNDTFYARDGQADRVVGWTGTDRAQIDRGLDRRSSIERLF